MREARIEGRTDHVGDLGMFQDAQDVKTMFEAQGYITTDAVATAVYIADALEKPLLVEGPAGGRRIAARTD